MYDFAGFQTLNFVKIMYNANRNIDFLKYPINTWTEG